MRLCNSVDENFQHDFVIYIDYCITEACITNSITDKSLHNNRDIFYYEMALVFFMHTIAKPHVKRLTVSLIAERQAGKL